MKKPTFLLFLFLSAAMTLADDQLRDVQTQLKTQGFYYGEITGQASPETTAALRRYQIRNGLEVTGTANKETLGAMGLGPAVPAQQAAPPPAAPAATPAPARKPPVNLLKDDHAEESDREFLMREEAQRRAAATASPAAPPEPRDPGVLRPPTPLDAPGDDYPVIFARTPYAGAPREVQQRTLRMAQAALADRGFYRDIVDGLPGPSTVEAIIAYQRVSRLPLTGRLDMETLGSLRLLPNRNLNPFPSTRRVYRGIWVN